MSNKAIDLALCGMFLAFLVILAVVLFLASSLGVLRPQSAESVSFPVTQRSTR